MFHVEAALEAAITLPGGGTVSLGGSFGLVSDADNNLGITITTKTAAGPSAGFSIGFTASYTHRNHKHQPIITDVEGPGREYSIGVVTGSGSVGFGVDDLGNRLLPRQGGYTTYGGGVWGSQLEFGVFNWKTQTTVLPIW